MEAAANLSTSAGEGITTSAVESNGLSSSTGMHICRCFQRLYPRHKSVLQEPGRKSGSTASQASDVASHIASNYSRRHGGANAKTSSVAGSIGGFTLAELLVVIGILGLLAALLLPVLARAKDRSRAIQCVNNLRQWGLAYRMYADDYNDFLPRRGQGVQVLALITRPEDWFNALPVYFSQPGYLQAVQLGQKPKAKDHSLFICPDATDPGMSYFLCYGMNMNLSPWNLQLPTKYNQVVAPSSVVALGESPGPYSSTYPSTQAYSAVARHVGRANLLFLTGQVRSFSGAYVGCGAGDPGRADVHWLTGTDSDAQAHNY